MLWQMAHVYVPVVACRRRPHGISLKIIGRYHSKSSRHGQSSLPSLADLYNFSDTGRISTERLFCLERNIFIIESKIFDNLCLHKMQLPTQIGVFFVFLFFCFFVFFVIPK